MAAVPKAVPSAVPSAVVPLRQSAEGIAPYRESAETADYPGANVHVLAHVSNVNPSGNRHWGGSGDAAATTAEGFAPSIPGASALPQRIMPLQVGGSVGEADKLVTKVTGRQAPNADRTDLFVQRAVRLDNNGKQSTNNTGQMTSYPSPDGETYKQHNLGTQSQMQGFAMTSPAAHPFNQQQTVPAPQARNTLPAGSGVLADGVFGAVWQGTGSTVVNVSDVPSTVTGSATPVYAPLGWG